MALGSLPKLSKPNVPPSRIYTYQATDANSGRAVSCQTLSTVGLLSEKCHGTALVICRPSNIFLLFPPCGVSTCAFPKSPHKGISWMPPPIFCLSSQCVIYMFPLHRLLMLVNFYERLSAPLASNPFLSLLMALIFPTPKSFTLFLQ